jgi:hypothetical protein
MNWINEGRAYVKLPGWDDYKAWAGHGVDCPDFSSLRNCQALFKAEVKHPPKFEIGQRVNIAEEKRVAPNPDYAYGIVIGIDIDVDGTVTYRMLLRSGPYRREIAVEEKYLVLAEHAAQPVSEPKFKVGQEVKVTRPNGDVIWARDKSYVSDLRLEDGKYRYHIETPGVGAAYDVAETCITAVEEKAKFKAGDRVYLSCEGHYHNKQTGTVIKQLVTPLETEVYTVQFDGHTCTHNLCADALLLVRFKVGEKVGWLPACRFERFVHLEVVKILGRIADLLVYQLKGTTRDGSVQIVSARDNVLFPCIAGFTEFAVGQQVYVSPDHPVLGKYAELRIRYREPGMTNDPKYALDCYEKNRLKHFVGYAKQSELMYCEPAEEPIQKTGKKL